ncbi:MAG: response regulator [Candidatus Omnitrophica bacterium]|nr:response regulator [Candidatus Omnitrophota bacterium]
MRLLLVEDNPIDVKLVQAAFRRQADEVIVLETVGDLQSGLAALQTSEPFDLILLDLTLPDSAGLDTFRRVNASAPDIAVIVATGTDDEKLALEAMHSGAQDYLVKGRFDLHSLIRICRYAIERKKNEREIKAANSAMARHERVLTETLESLKKSNEELKATRLQLIQAAKLEVVGRLAAGVAHEVKNPLAMLRMGLDYFLKDDRLLNKTDVFMLESMNEAIQRADSVIKEMLDFSSLQRLEMQAGDLNQLVQRALFLMKHELDRKGVQVEICFDANMPPVYMDKNRIEQVVVNLITNALQAIREHPQLVIRTQSLPVEQTGFRVGNRKGDYFQIGECVAFLEVVDNGSGIDAENSDKIFDPFFTTKLTEGGTGLGLSIVKSIMEMHKGFIRIVNRPEGGGAVASLILKLADKVPHA